jgi:DNA mismatch endonuclease (patch repair protein)
MTSKQLFKDVPDERRALMGRIKGANTKPELVVRRILHAMGRRFRLHRKDLPGRPDIVLPRFRTAIFVHGCFWHRHSGCRGATTPKTREEFWRSKFEANVARDSASETALAIAGWRVVVIWECETKDAAKLEARLSDELGAAL